MLVTIMTTSYSHSVMPSSMTHKNFGLGFTCCALEAIHLRRFPETYKCIFTSINFLAVRRGYVTMCTTPGSDLQKDLDVFSGISRTLEPPYAQ